MLCCVVTSRYRSSRDVVLESRNEVNGDDDDDSNNNTRHTLSSPFSTYITLQKFRL